MRDLVIEWLVEDFRWKESRLILASHGREYRVVIFSDE